MELVVQGGHEQVAGWHALCTSSSRSRGRVKAKTRETKSCPPLDYIYICDFDMILMFDFFA